MTALPAHPVREATRVDLVDIAPSADRAWSWPPIIAVCLTVWVVARVVFFVGFVGSDDLYHVRFAALWDRAPQNHWEARLIANLLFAGAMRLFGRGEVAAALPCMIASLAVLGATLVAAARWLDRRAALWAGLIVALLPIDVETATIVSAGTIMHGLVAVGTVALLIGVERQRWTLVGPMLLAVGVVTHLSATYYVAALSIAALAVDWRRYGRAVVTTGACVAIALLLDLGLFQYANGDALARFKIFVGQASVEPAFPGGDRATGLPFLTWPFVNLLYSKGLGIAGALALIMGIARHRAWSAPFRVLLLGCGVYWLWVNFGSRVPWSYQPFWRIVRYWQPATIAIAVACASAIVLQRRPWMRALTAAAVLGVCVVNLAASGPWSQRVEVSKALLSYVRAHPNESFVTDDETLNEMYILNGVAPVPNVATIYDEHPVRLLDRSALRLDPAEASGRAVLVNPLNAPRHRAFHAYLVAQDRPVVYQSDPQDRLICRIIPPLRAQPWALRRPAGFVLAAQGRERRSLRVADG